MSHGFVNEVESDEEFDAIISSSGERLVVVDFFAQWCGPCKAIAPFMAQLSTSYPDTTFLKVDVDRLVLTAQKCGISSMPTFYFYKNGILIEKFSGADQNRLENTVRTYGVIIPKQPEKPKSPYKHFPVEGFVYFDTGKMEQILPKVLQFNTDLQKEGNSNALNEVELKSLQRLADTIKNTSFYHSSSFEPEEYKVMAKLARWPPTKRFPALDVLRLMVLHPHAADHYAVAHAKDQDDNLVDIVISYLLEDVVVVPNLIMTWRFISNMFRFESLRSIALEMNQQLLEFVSVFLKNENVQIRTAVATVLLNLAVAACFYAKQTNETKEAQQQGAETIRNMLAVETDPEVQYRLLAALGTLAYCDESKSIIKSSTSVPDFSSATLEKLVEAAKELRQLSSK
jgi:thioredoxin